MDLSFEEHIRKINDWPRTGIMTYDIAPILADPILYKKLIDEIASPYREKDISMVLGIESRGFIIAAALADRIGSGLGLIRKKGKIAPPVLSQEYSYEYASQVIEISERDVKSGDRVLLVDDILATGGTMSAAIKLVKKTGAEIIGAVFVIEMDNMAGRTRLQNTPVHAIVHCD
ncbi:MAG: adenine phosphoribosyltransferase [Candidatus Magasanikbacteria bacterium]|nr:adenine phosphoribosyltransferase [Candidatus Magasanikbacteria bacterium]